MLYECLILLENTPFNDNWILSLHLILLRNFHGDLDRFLCVMFVGTCGEGGSIT